MVASGDVVGYAGLGDVVTGSRPISSLASSSITFGADEGGVDFPLCERGSA